MSAVVYGLAGVAYLVAGKKTWRILHTRRLRTVDGADRWWPSHRFAETSYVREQMLNDLAAAYTENRSLLNEKTEPLNGLLVAVAIETLLVAAAVVTSLA
jgi:hypothetical protein